MAALKLNGNHTLLIEADGKKLRVVIVNGTTELACRKETPGRLKSFLASPKTQLFKGRLQLHKTDEVLTVMLKGQSIGVLGIQEFAGLL